MMRPASLVTGTVDCDMMNTSSTYTLCLDNGGNSGIDYLVTRSSSSSKGHSTSPYRWDSHLLPLSGLPYEAYSSSSQHSLIKLERLYVNNPNCQVHFLFLRASEISNDIDLDFQLSDVWLQVRSTVSR